MAVVSLLTTGSEVVHAVHLLRFLEQPADPRSKGAQEVPVDQAPSRPGDRGATVAQWQEDLDRWLAAYRPDVPPVPVDGDFGPETEQATRIFQDASGDVPTDLVVDAEDRAALTRALEVLPSA
jgi:peptidoglycan hydrolase-like protein with peptidoglycan-binding domain